ncbi:FYN-binding protein 2 [Phaethornis superciliosus]
MHYPVKFSSGLKEAVTDFKALRAKFQNDSNLANKLVQPPKMPPTKTSPRLGSGGNAVSSPLPLRKREERILKSKDEQAQASALTQCNPLRWPRAKLSNLDPNGPNEEGLEKGLSSLEKSPEKPLPSYTTDQHGPALTPSEDPLLPYSFHHALQIWENTSSCGEKASVKLPTQRAANIYVQPCPEQRMKCSPDVSGGSGVQPSGSEPILDLHGQEQDAPCGSGPVLPQASRRHKGSAEAAAESLVATAICQLGYCAPTEKPQHQNESEPPFSKPRAGKWSESPGSKQPRIKPLPSAESLGPPPGKPARPPKFDLGPFQSAVPSAQRANKTNAGKENYLTPKSAQLEEQHNYEETLMYLNQSGDTTTLSVIEVSKAKPEEHEKQKSCLFAKSSLGRAIIEEKEEKTSVEGEKKEAKKIFRPGGNESVSPSSQTKEDGRAGMKVPQLEQDVTSTQTAKHPAPQGLAKDGVEQLHYMYVGTSKPIVEGTTLNQNTWQLLPAPEEIYDDVEKIQDRLSQTSDASSPSASATISGNSYEEIYEDVEIGSDKPAKVETAKPKRFANLFNLEKLKLKNIKLKENLRLFSVSVPNLDSEQHLIVFSAVFGLPAAAPQEDIVYDNVEVWQSKLREKDDKYKVRMPKFLMAKEDKNRRKSSDDGERNIFRLKKSKAEKIKKMEKEEEIFRETFLYNKEINVISTATAECSVPSKRRVDLPVTAGEQLDVLDVTEGKAVICRNAEGRYGYVLVEHLNFRQTVQTAPRAALPSEHP